MTSRRSTLRALGRTARIGLRTALHLRPAPPSAPPRAAAPAVLASVAAVIGLVIATGNSAEARSLTGARAVASTAEARTVGASPGVSVLASDAQIAKAMAAVAPPVHHSAGSARAS